MGAAEAAMYEAPGFHAVARVLAFIEKYSKPAPGGGRSAAAGAAMKRARKAKSRREYLETKDDQRFPDLCMYDSQTKVQLEVPSSWFSALVTKLRILYPAFPSFVSQPAVKRHCRSTCVGRVLESALLRAGPCVCDVELEVML